MSNCPRCKVPMKETKVAGVALDRCSQCLGIFFDNFEMKKFDEPHEGQGEKIFEEDKAAPSKPRATNEKLSCPKCAGIVMIKRFSSIKRQVEIDECAKCGGVWVDPGEISQIRGEFKTEAERVNAAEALYDDILSGDMAGAKAEGDAEVQKYRRIGEAMKYLAPSWYISGKQKWGAW